MKIIEPSITQFKPIATDRCIKLRTEAFNKLFLKEIGRDAVIASAGAYAPEDIIRLAESNPFFVAEVQKELVGFIGSKIHDENTIEILFLYVHLGFLKQGIGSGLLGHFEEYITKNLPNINLIVVDTIIPKYNQKFYEKMGYVKAGDSFCNYPSGKVRAVRLQKRL